ncbi:MAG: phosphoribosylformylglycinamidine cyclo-ligase [Candidatus Dadabacteria bacterium]|nr:phosphoribosylformylglycinamidine cyclo-ligase [Candidatus Dadabacteria bacterium]
MPKKTTYKDSGVDIDEGSRFVELIKPLVRSTYSKNVVETLGGFSGLFSLPIGEYKDPLLVSSTDGVGTKLKLAFMTGVLDTIGIDLVAMCVNDVVTCGAKPLFFLDYISTSKLVPEQAAGVVKGIAEGCRQAGCALLGGETAEMPDFYKQGEFDLAGFAVGIVEREGVVDGASVVPGDAVIGLRSSGLHSNGFSLVRKVLLEELGMELSSRPEGFDATLGETLLEPTRIYVKPVHDIAGSYPLHAIAHITGGGLPGNIARVLPEGCAAELDSSLWTVPPIFDLLKDKSGLGWDEMYGTFNCGVGMALVTAQRDAPGILSRLEELGEGCCVIGKVMVRGDGKPPVVVK